MIDIIIPIYNGYEDLKKCLYSVERYTDLGKNRVVLINDKSTDERVFPFLKEWAQQRQGTILIDNEENKGFSGNVNMGFRLSDNDVILLNTDTIVTNGWVEKLSACAQADQQIATVTPLSNNATLASVPEFCASNPLPEGWTVDDMGILVEQCSLHRYPEVTVAVGFCMYIKRETIHKVGYFDAETFGKGYGEENDFCYRAGQLGMRHVLCDDTYIYHSGTVSFQNTEKLALLRAHEKILRQRYPLQVYANEKFVAENPIHEIQDNIRLNMGLKLLENGKKNVLMVSHLDFREDAQEHIGGVQFHLNDLVGTLKDQYNVLVAARDGENLNLTVYFETYRLSFKYPIGDKKPFPRLQDQEIDRQFERILQDFPIDAVHIHQVYQLSFGIFDLAFERQIPVFVTLHDYYYICPNIKLLDTEDQICTGTESEKECERCLWKRSRLKQPYSYLENWRTECSKRLMRCTWIISPSEKTKEIYLHYYPQLSEKIQVIGHGYDLPERINVPMHWDYEVSDEVVGIFENINQVLGCELQVIGWAYLKNYDSAKSIVGIEVDDGKNTLIYPAKTVPRGDLATENSNWLYSGFVARIPPLALENGDVKFRIVIKNDNRAFGAVYQHKMHDTPQLDTKSLNVGFIGGFNVAKGSQLMLQLFERRPNNCNFIVMGEIGDPKLKQFKMKGLVKTGPYNRSQLADYLAEFSIDVVCIFSIWDETFCYTMSEALAAGLPVIVTNNGAPAQRVQDDNCGWVLNGEEDVLDQAGNLLERIASDRSLLKDKIDNINAMHLKTVEEMTIEYQTLYERFTPDKKNPWVNNAPIRDAYCYAHMPQSENRNMAKELEETQEQVRLLQRDLDSIHRAKSYRMLVKMNNLRKKILH